MIPSQMIYNEHDDHGQIIPFKHTLLLRQSTESIYLSVAQTSAQTSTRHCVCVCVCVWLEKLEKDCLGVLKLKDFRSARNHHGQVEILLTKTNGYFMAIFINSSRYNPQDQPTARVGVWRLQMNGGELLGTWIIGQIYGHHHHNRNTVC